MSLEQAKATVATKTLPRVTEESITARISDVFYIGHNHLTICVITMQNGFMVHGVSAPASLGNYDAEVGKRYAYENAFRQLWQLEGYLLRDALHREGRA
jgi:hypothetical protein